MLPESDTEAVEAADADGGDAGFNQRQRLELTFDYYDIDPRAERCDSRRKIDLHGRTRSLVVFLFALRDIKTQSAVGLAAAHERSAIEITMGDTTARLGYPAALLGGRRIDVLDAGGCKRRRCDPWALKLETRRYSDWGADKLWCVHERRPTVWR